MRHYEAMFIVDPETDEETLEAIFAKYSKVVTDGGGEVTEVGKWNQGRRQLAYEISQAHKTYREGIYVLLQFVSDAKVPAELDRIFRISDDVFRHLVVRQNEDEE
jgi:small subunit ribosomal protein S6